ncbi:flagellar protein FlhE [Castellaniella sp. WN]
MVLVAGLARAGDDQAWTRDRVGQGLQARGRAVVVLYGPGPRGPAVPASARITQVYASRDYDSSARISTRLCWGSEQGPCVPLEGRSVETHAFDGRAARGPLLLVHRVEGWGDDHPPVFVRGTVTVWFDGR